MAVATAALCVAISLSLRGSGRDRPSINTDKPTTDNQTTAKHTTMADTPNDAEPFATKTDAEWKKTLTPEQYHVTRRKGTERAFTGEYWNSKQPGTYRCVGCGADLFSSETKFDSGTGWPSFWQPVRKENVKLAEDNGFFTQRVEVLCDRCGAHLGHVFEDGPRPSGLRYCINSVALRLDSTGPAASRPSTPPAEKDGESR
jgi:peptide-methionine (R)-S-oxide reductase